MIDAVLEGLVRANLLAAAAIVLVLLARRPVRRRFGARVAYALWAAPPVVALASLLPQAEVPTPLEPIGVLAGAAADSLAPPIPPGPDLPALLAAVWLGGVLATALMLAQRQSRFMASLGRLQPLPGAPGVLRAERPGVGPAVVGALRPRIVTPADFEQRFEPAERDVILAHEQVHLTCGDAAVNALAAAAQCAAWFNPLVHLGVRAMRIDQELACDAAVLARFPAARRTYAEALLKTQLSAQPLPLGCRWPAGSEHPLKERIAMLKSPLPARRRRTAGAVLVAGVSLGLACAAWATQAPPPLIAQPDWIQRPTAEDVKQFYPPEALRRGVGGMAIIACQVAADGRLTGCVLDREEPAGLGFGAAALAMAERFRMQPMTKDGHPVAGGRVRIPIRFGIPAAQAAR